MNRCRAEEAVLVVIDVQEKLLPVIRESDALVRSLRFLMDAAELFSVPTILTEQYPRGLGSTVAELSGHPGVTERIEKLRFSAARELVAGSTISSRSPSPVIILAGIESHICVQQTALELRDAGHRVMLVADCCGSRFIEDHAQAIQRMTQCGVIMTTAESLAFEWCDVAGTDTFRNLSRLVRSRVR